MEGRANPAPTISKGDFCMVLFILTLILICLLVLIAVSFFLFRSIQQQTQSTQERQAQQNQFLQQNLQNTTGQIHSRLDRTSEVVNAVSHQLGALSQATEKVFETTKNIASLEDILKPPKLRGTLGETLLEEILKQVLPEGQFFEMQYAFKDGQIVDALIHLKDYKIPIDAKFPLESFKRLLECKEEPEKQRAQKEFVRTVKKHMDAIADKYILPHEGTVDFCTDVYPCRKCLL